MTNFPTFVKRETENFPTFIYVNNKPLKMNAIDLTNQMDLADRPDGTDTVRPPGPDKAAGSARKDAPVLHGRPGLPHPQEPLGGNAERQRKILPG